MFQPKRSSSPPHTPGSLARRLGEVFGAEFKERRKVLGKVRVEPLRVLGVDVDPPGKGNSYFNGARPLHLSITMMKWIWISRLSMKNSLSSNLILGQPTSDTGVRRSQETLTPLGTP